MLPSAIVTDASEVCSRNSVSRFELNRKIAPPVGVDMFEDPYGTRSTISRLMWASVNLIIPIEAMSILDQIY